MSAIGLLVADARLFVPTLCCVIGLLGPLPSKATVFVETEPNNSFAQADQLNPHDTNVQVSGTYNGPDSNGFIDDDFFRFYAATGDVISVSLTTDLPSGNFSLFLYDPTQTFTGVAVFGSHPSFVFPVEISGDSYITVAGLTPFRSGTYTLNITGLSPPVPAPVPEPDTYIVFALGLGALTIVSARRDARSCTS